PRPIAPTVDHFGRSDRLHTMNIHPKNQIIILRIAVIRDSAYTFQVISVHHPGCRSYRTFDKYIIENRILFNVLVDPGGIIPKSSPYGPLPAEVFDFSCGYTSWTVFFQFAPQYIQLA